MKDSKKQKGTKVKLTKGKRVSLRCPLTIDSTVLEYNYDASCAQICLTVENMGGGGVTDDCVESAIVVIRLFDAEGTLIPCTKNDYFAKLLRFGDEGLKSGSNITFRLTPDCTAGLRVENAELYISRVRYADGSVTDYLRGDFFDLPGDPTPLHKKYKKHLDEITAKFGQTALYEPEELTEIIWRCTCGEFSESDHCAACSASKTELFGFFRENAASKKAAAAVVGDPGDSGATASDALATDATTEYDASSLAGGMQSMADASDSDASDMADQDDSDSDAHEFRAAPQPKKADKLKISLIIAIVASAVLLAVIIGLLIFTVIIRNKQQNPAPEVTTGATTTGATTTDIPKDPDLPVVSDEELIVRAYLESNDFDNALGYARANDCSDELINEILTSAVHYYTEVAPDVDKAMQFAEELNDTTSIDSLNLQRYNEAMEKGDYQSAIGYAERLSQDKDAKISAAAEALVQSQLAANDYDGALKTVETYTTTTTEADITLAAITFYTENNEFDKALALAAETADGAQTAAVAKAAVNYYIAQQNYDRAVDYVTLTGDSADILALIPHFTQPGIKRHLPVFFPYLSFEEKQAVHASVMSNNGVAGIVDVYGNAFWSADGAHRSAETGKKVVSIECTQLTTVLLFSDGTVALFGDDSQDVSTWKNIVAISASNFHTVGLTADGKVVATGRISEKQCDVGQYSNAVAVAAGSYHTLVLFSDGTVAATGQDTSGQCNTSDWTDIVAISAGFLHSVGLKSDGTVVAAGSAGAKRCDVDEWTNVIQVSAGYNCTAALTSDGTVLLASADSSNGDVSGMTNVIRVSAGVGSVTVLCSNGTLLATGNTPPDLSYVSGFEILTKIYGVQ